MDALWLHNNKDSHVVLSLTSAQTQSTVVSLDYEYARHPQVDTTVPNIQLRLLVIVR